MIDRYGKNSAIQLIRLIENNKIVIIALTQVISQLLSLHEFTNEVAKLYQYLGNFN